MSLCREARCRTLGTPFSMSFSDAADSAQRKARRQATRMTERRPTAGSLTTLQSCAYAVAMPSMLSSTPLSSPTLHVAAAADAAPAAVEMRSGRVPCTATYYITFASD